MINMNDIAVVRWMVEALANAGSPDPEGLVAQMQLSNGKGNFARVNPSQAQAAGYDDVSEPLTSFTAAAAVDASEFRGDVNALRRSVATPAVAERAIANRHLVTQTYDQAIQNNVPPKNPFINANGQIILHREFPKQPIISDPEKELNTLVGGMLDDIEAGL